MIYMEERHWEIVENILKKYPYTFYAFGSRVKGTQKRFSDLDLCVKEPLPPGVWSHILEDFEESNLPFKVDVVQWAYTNSDFKNIIKNDLIPLELSENHAETHH
jgi:predicted nucleotidyltransferase